MTIDRSRALARSIVELAPVVHHDTTRYASNRWRPTMGGSKARLRPMRGLKGGRTAAVVISGHALMQNLRLCNQGLGAEARRGLTVPTAVDELTRAA